jgi:hypothetical protein
LPALAKPATQAVPAAPAKAAEKPKGAKPTQAEAGGIVANVPLFGPTPMATMEPAPLGAAPDAQDAPEDEEAAEKAAAAAAVDDATWTEPSKSSTSPSDVKPWGRGGMHLPTIHKLRLDGPASALSGS